MLSAFSTHRISCHVFGYLIIAWNCVAPSLDMGEISRTNVALKNTRLRSEIHKLDWHFSF